VTELTQLIRAKSRPRPDKVKDSSEFPDFVWTVRDVTLELKLDSHDIRDEIPGECLEVDSRCQSLAWVG
jgi:hypothetical protein